MAPEESETTAEYVTWEDQKEVMSLLIEQSLENIMHDILLEVHQDEKISRMQTAVIELEDRAHKLGRKSNGAATDDQDPEAHEPVETKAATFGANGVQLKGNPMKTVKHIRCPNCRLRRLLYPRVGFNSRPVPDPAEQYCKQEPMIIIDKHDVHGQRKKGVKMKGQAKGKNKKKNEPPSPASENSEPVTPLSSMPESFDFKEIDYPAAKCPNRESHLGDHWKAVNIFATHLNGSCYLKRDRIAGREANAKIGGTPRDSRANSPKPATTNGVKRKAGEDDIAPPTKKKQKISELKKNAKGAVGAPSKLRETSTNAEDKSTDSPIKPEPNGDTIHVTPKARDDSTEPSVKLKLTGLSAKEGKKAKSSKKT